MPLLNIEGGQIYYQISGQSGKWVVLIHGAWASKEWWREQIPVLAQKNRILFFDLRGHGQSSALPPNFSFPGFVRDLKILLDEIGIEEAAFIGWSLGGLISMEFYLNHPQLTRNLILIATRSRLHPFLKKRIWWAFLRAQLNLMINLSAPRKFNRQKESFPDEKQLLEEEIEKMFTSPIKEEVKEWIKAQLRNYTINNYWQMAKDLWAWEISEENLKKIIAPTLLLVGEKDQITPPIFSKIIHEAIPHSRLIVIKEAGHLLPLERPQEVNYYITEFLQSTEN